MKSAVELFNYVVVCEHCREAYDKCMQNPEEYKEYGSDTCEFIICTVVSEHYGWKQAGALAEVLEMSFADLNIEPLPEGYTSEEFIEYVSKQEWIFDTMEKVCAKLSDEINAALKLEHGHLSLGWFDGGVELRYLVEVDAEDDEEDICYREKFNGEWVCINDHTECIYNNGHNGCGYHGDDNSPLEEDDDD